MSVSSGEGFHRRAPPALPSLFASLDADRRFRMANDAWKTWLKTAHPPGAGTPLFEALPGCDTAIRPHLDAALLGRTSHFEASLRLANGARSVRGAVFPETAEGRVTGMFLVMDDVTERREAEKDREDLLLQQATLLESVARQAMELSRTNKELEHFAFITSHDLKEPLRKVSSYADLLAGKLKGGSDDGERRYLRSIIEGVERMKALIDALLSYSRGPEPAPGAMADLNAVVRDTLEDLEPLTAARRATVAAEHLPTVAAEPIHIREILQNLVANAVKFCDHPAPAVEIYAEPRGDQWMIAVRDNGIGIEPKYWERIFQVFQRLHTREKYPGTGIGLAIAKKIVEHYGGKIWVSSEPGQGSTFFFTLPKAATADYLKSSS